MDTSSASSLTPLLNRHFDAVLWDMDGTLISSIHVTERCWGQWMEHYGYPAEHYHQFHGTPARTIVETLLPAHLHDEGFHRIVDLEMNDTTGITLLPGAHQALAALPPQRRAIITSSTRDLALRRLEVTGITMDTLVTADDVTHGKPHPDPYLRAAHLLGVDPTRCVVFEDAPSGLAAGRAAGCVTVGLPGTHALADLTADVLLPSLEAIQVVSTEEGVVFNAAL